MAEDTNFKQKEHVMLEKDDLAVIEEFVGSGGMYLDVVYSGHFDTVGVTEERLKSLIERGYLVRITSDTYGLALSGVVEAQKMMKPWNPPLRIISVTLDELTEEIAEGAREVVLTAVIELEKRGIKPDYVRIGMNHYGLRLEARK